MELSQSTQRLLGSYQQWYRDQEPKGAANTITVDEVASRVASFYEKIRGVVDWREEHLLRKTAIERILKRRFFLNTNTQEMAEPLLQELIRGGHFPNNRIPVEKIGQVQNTINKYHFLVEKNKDDWVLSVAASEIEETLSPPTREKALIQFMAQDLQQKIQLRERDRGKISERDQQLLLSIAVQRALFKVDDSTIALHLFEQFYPNWETLLPTLKTTVKNLLASPLGEKFYRIAEQYDTSYLILGDILSRDPNGFSQLAQNPSEFEAAVKHFYATRLGKLKRRMRRAAFFSTLSVFLSKVLIALAVEVPIDRLTGEFNPAAAGLSIAIPPLFLLFLIGTVRSSSEENFQRVLLEVSKITFQSERKDVYHLALPRAPKGVLNAAVRMVYLLSFVFVFGALTLVLRNYGFSILSVVVFLLFLSLVAYAGTRIRHRSRELIVGEPKQGFLLGILDFFLLPVVQVGKWLSQQLPRYNILIILINVLLEAPFQVFVEFLEQLRTFWKEKKEEIH
ncbi:MAG: hypothetical protein HYS52_00055 [Candidatus Wildermuthbacteria bacterium]|nr:hypothetical protein [Candidatus Wildermuthbacteria bacterium]